MAFTYLMCVCLVATIVAVYARSISELSDHGSNDSVLTRVKRNVVTGGRGDGCAIGYFRFRLRCLTCKEIGRKIRKRTKICEGKCVDAHHSCPKHR